MSERVKQTFWQQKIVFLAADIFTLGLWDLQYHFQNLSPVLSHHFHFTKTSQSIQIDHKEDNKHKWYDQ